MQSKSFSPWSGQEVFYEKEFNHALMLVVDLKGDNYLFQARSERELSDGLKELEKNLTRVIEVKYVIPIGLKNAVDKSILALGTKAKGEYTTGPLEILIKGYPARLFVASPTTKSVAPKRAPVRQGPYKVLIVDDSPTIQKVMSKVLEGSPDFKIEHIASSGEEALEYLRSHTPDVMTLDINMPGMSGVDVLKKLQDKVPPTVLVTGLSMNEGPLVLEALEHGALDYIQKPEMSALESFKTQLLERLAVAAAARKPRSETAPARSSMRVDQNLDLSRYPSIVAIGASTGGTEAIKNLLKTLPPRFPPIVIVQHIPPVFSKAFADRLNQILPFKIAEARDGDRVGPGEVLIAPGGIHMRVVKKGSDCYVALDDQTPERTGHRPSVDVLFESVAKQYPKDAMGILLTGMGADGAQGLLQMKQTGSLTVTQDEETCVVYGMPKKAVQLGASLHELALLKIGPFVSEELAKRLRK